MLSQSEYKKKCFEIESTAESFGMKIFFWRNLIVSTKIFNPWVFFSEK